MCVPRHNGTARAVSGLIPILIPSVDHYWLGRVLGSRDSTLKDEDLAFTELTCLWEQWTTHDPFKHIFCQFCGETQSRVRSYQTGVGMDIHQIVCDEVGKSPKCEQRPEEERISRIPWNFLEYLGGMY